MAKKLTSGQKAARAAVRAAAREVIAKVDSMKGRRESNEFTAHFHLDCDRRNVGNVSRYGLPVYAYSWTRTKPVKDQSP